MTNDNLQHWGIKGMRWGVRRFQNSDGTLTPAGKKRYEKEMTKLKAEERVEKNKARTKAKLDKLEEKRQSIEKLRDDNKKAEEKPKKKSSTMTDDELRDAIARLDLEKRYRQLMTEKKEVSKAAKEKSTGIGKKFVTGTLKSIGGKMLLPALEDTGKQLIKSLLVKSVNDSDLIKNLGDEYKLHTNNKKKS